ncbi:hypothetical protein [Dyella sp. ASV21]|uniref:DUF3617 domain-containing protein n=1 Tax=Dyella sp. ASV21 TaxID=2795114 RepID=UPI0018EDD8D7|nr:hypothetical protein [Dyella sp. ASV21]
MNPFRQAAEAPRTQAVARVIAVLVLLAAAVIGEPSHADPGDFQAMPGLWKIVTHKLDHGHPGPALVQWHCVDESPDPWSAFANLPAPTTCERSDAHRSSTALAWSLRCGGSSHPVGTGRVDFDSPEHYTASVSLDGHEVVQAEGRRYAACTSAND